MILILLKKYKDTFIIGSLIAILISPWYAISRLIYHQKSLFLYYPFFLSSLGTDPKIAIKEFFNTPLVDIIKIKLNYLYYLLTPFYFLKKQSEGFFNLIFNTSLFTLPGSIGVLILPASIFMITTIRKNYKILISFVVVPIFLSTILVGNPVGIISSLHYLQPIVVLMVGLAVHYLLKTNWFILIPIFILNLIVYAVLSLYVYNFDLLPHLNTRFLILYSTALIVYLYLTGNFVYYLSLKSK